MSNDSFNTQRFTNVSVNNYFFLVFFHKGKPLYGFLLRITSFYENFYNYLKNLFFSTQRSLIEFRKKMLYIKSPVYMESTFKDETVLNFFVGTSWESSLWRPYKIKKRTSKVDYNTRTIESFKRISKCQETRCYS